MQDVDQLARPRAVWGNGSVGRVWYVPRGGGGVIHCTRQDKGGKATSANPLSPVPPDERAGTKVGGKGGGMEGGKEDKVEETVRARRVGTAAARSWCEFSGSQAFVLRLQISRSRFLGHCA